MFSVVVCTEMNLIIAIYSNSFMYCFFFFLYSYLFFFWGPFFAFLFGFLFGKFKVMEVQVIVLYKFTVLKVPKNLNGEPKWKDSMLAKIVGWGRD